MRVVIEIKRDAMADVVLNQLYRFSQLQSTFGVNNIALTGGRPELLNLKDLLQAFIAFREEVVTTAHQVPAEQVARPGPYFGGARHRRCQYR